MLLVSEQCYQLLSGYVVLWHQRETDKSVKTSKEVMSRLKSTDSKWTITLPDPIQTIPWVWHRVPCLQLSSFEYRRTLGWDSCWWCWRKTTVSLKAARASARQANASLPQMYRLQWLSDALQWMSLITTSSPEVSVGETVNNKSCKRHESVLEKILHDRDMCLRYWTQRGKISVTPSLLVLEQVYRSLGSFSGSSSSFFFLFFLPIEFVVAVDRCSRTKCSDRKTKNSTLKETSITRGQRDSASLLLELVSLLFRFSIRVLCSLPSVILCLYFRFLMSFFLLRL